MFISFLTETTLVDTFALIAGDPGNLPTYSRGTKRINYMFTSNALVPYISRVGYLAFFQSNMSDHKGLFMDISESIIDTKIYLLKPTKRYIGSKSKPHIIYKYKQYIHKQFLIHKIYERAEILSKIAEATPITQELLDKINRLDNQITEIMLAAEKQVCPKQHDTEWSAVLHNQSQLCKFWAVVVKGTWNKIDTTQRAIDIFTSLPDEMQQEIQRATDYHHPTTTRRICYRQLWLAAKYHKQLTRIHKELRRQRLLSLKEMRIREGNLPAATIIENIARYEKHNEDLAIIKALKGS
jgi:hypothetical protein